jgi:hypothetical protein
VSAAARLNKQDCAALAATLRDINELFDAEAISAEERSALLRFAWDTFARDSLPTTDPRTSAMNPKTVMEIIERNHAVMAAQVARLGEMPPASLLALPNDAAPADVAAVLDNALRDQLYGATQVMRTLAEVEAAVRAKTARSPDGSTFGREPEVIDVEPVVVRTEVTQ